MLKKIKGLFLLLIGGIVGFVAGVIAVFKLFGKILNTDVGRDVGIRHIKEIISDGVEWLLYGAPRRRPYYQNYRTPPSRHSYADYYQNYSIYSGPAVSFASLAELESFKNKVCKHLKIFGSISTYEMFYMAYGEEKAELYNSEFNKSHGWLDSDWMDMDRIVPEFNFIAKKYEWKLPRAKAIL